MNKIPRARPLTARQWRIIAGIVLLIIILSWAWSKLRYRMSYAADLKDRPWAYTETGAKLLVGSWQGTFTDPAGIEKQLTVSIDEPVTEAERTKKLQRRSRDRGGPKPSASKHTFDGTARITSKLGTESYELYGAVDKSDYHQLHFSFGPEDEQKRILPNFTAREANPGTWKEDTLTLTLHFTKHLADGTSTSTSTSEGEVVDGKMVWKESPEEKSVVVSLQRK